ncbi:hypothetical protein OAC12_01415 [Porticoccaceae bacterium]|nr:hypothetical protein [Porticoccaceae bacterium]
MKNTILIVSIFLAAVSLNVLGDGHLSEEQSKGAFTTLMVSAKDTDKYVKSVKSNPGLYKAIGADAGGYCRTVSGQDYPGQLMMWTAFPTVTAALVGAGKYDPSNASRAMQNMREFKYGTTWAPLKGFSRLDPGYERAMRIKVSPANVPALVAALTKLEKEIQDAGHNTFLNGLFVAIGGGTQEAGTLYLKSITADETTHGAVIDDYFSGASWGNAYLQATSLIDEIVNDQFEVCEQFYTAE